MAEVTYTYVWERPDVAMVAKEIGKRCNKEAKRREQDDEDKVMQYFQQLLRYSGRGRLTSFTPPQFC